MYKKFKGLSKLVRTILLLIPFVNWIVEIVVRWDRAVKDSSLINIVLAIVFTFGGAIFGFIDLIYNIVTDKLLFLE